MNNMNRRKFFNLIVLGAGGILLDQAIPFNRVWSFPKRIVLAGFDPAYGESRTAYLYRTGEMGQMESIFWQLRARDESWADFKYRLAGNGRGHTAMLRKLPPIH